MHQWGHISKYSRFFYEQRHKRKASQWVIFGLLSVFIKYSNIEARRTLVIKATEFKFELRSDLGFKKPDFKKPDFKKPN